jgi:hypothetical protein
MVEQALPPWGRDPLSTFLSNAQWNERALAVNVPNLYALLQRVHGVFEQVAAITEKESNEHLLPTRFLMARAQAAWLAAVRLGMSGQVVETYPLVRVVVENAWYALHLAKDSAPPARAEVWLRRSDDVTAERRCSTEFSIKNVRQTHATLDGANEQALHEVRGPSGTSVTGSPSASDVRHEVRDRRHPRLGCRPREGILREARVEARR